MAWLAMLVAASAVVLAAPAERAGAAGTACSTAGTWRQGELNVYWFDVEQGDSQLIIGPTGKTMLIDLGETAWNSTGASTNAAKVAARIKSICGVAGPVHLDYVLASHHHLDHIGYASNPNDTSTVGNGLYRLLNPAGEGFTVGTLIDRDGGTWVDTNGDGNCDVGTSAAPSDEVAWHNAGTVSQTAMRWICWLYGPAGQADRAAIQGHVVTATNSAPWPSIDLGTGVTVAILQANAKGVKQADGVTPVSGDHTADATPPSENDYSIAVKFTRGRFEYATAGDTDGEHATSGNGYTYNDVEASLTSAFGNVETVRANHHGSTHSSSDAYVNALAPESAFISCGVNSYGHPANRVLDVFQTVVNERGVGADVYLANNPCDDVDGTGAPIDYSGTFNHNGDVHLATTSSGAGYTVDYDAGTRTYAAYDEAPSGSAAASQVRVNEYLMAPSGTGQEWVELYNPASVSADVSGMYIDDVAAGGGSPKPIPAGTVIPAGGRWVMSFASGFLNNTGSDSVRYLAIAGGTETVYDTDSYSLGSTQYDKVFHRQGDGGTWCHTISTNVTKGTANPATCP
ncbi:MAG TPA: hypothetical protein VGB14_16975 [Acidimicrobiales bacterium]